MSETQATRRRYDRIAPIYDLTEGLIESALYRDWRVSLWSRMGAAKILEIGTGTGKNTAYYPEGAEVQAVDLSRKMLMQAGRHRQPAGVKLHRYQIDAQYLAFADDTFDAAIATFVFCSVPDPVQGLREARRVVKPGGRLLLLEHTRARTEPLGTIMDWMDPVTVKLMGPHINRQTETNVALAGWHQVTLKELDSFGIFMLIEAQRSG